MDLKLEKRVFELVKTITEACNDNPKIVKSLFGSVITNEAREIFKDLSQTHIPSMKEYDLVKVNGSYVVDRKDPEDEKFEGLKELRVVENIGKEMLRMGCFSIEKLPDSSGRDTVVYSGLVAKKSKDV